MLTYINEHPTAAEILTLVHGVTVTTASKLKKGMDQVNEQNFEKDFWSPEVMEVGQPESADDEFKESINFFNKKMRIN